MTAGMSVLHAYGHGDGAPQLPYVDLLDAIGYYVERAGGTDVLVQEITGGCLVVFRTAMGQHVVTLEPADIAHFRAEALERPDPSAHEDRHGWSLVRTILGHTNGTSDAHGDPDAAGPTTFRARLRAVGRYLDARHVMAVLVQEHADGYEVEFTAQPVDDDCAALTRLAERLDYRQLPAWSTAH